jgi:hypothetical protein
MYTRTPRDPWRTIWQVVTSDSLLVGLLFTTAAGLMATAWLPQTSTADPAAYARWLSEAQARYGGATQTMQALELFSITRSFGFRALLALIAGVLSLRLIEQGDRLCSQAQDRWTNLSPLLAQGGALLLLAGLLATHLWGWRSEELIVQGGQRAEVPGTGHWVALDEAGAQVTHSPGIVSSIEAHVPGMRISASDDAGTPLALQRAAEAEPLTQLALALDEDRYFAIPEAQLVVQLSPQPGETDETSNPVLVQVYRSPPGRLESERVVQGNAEVAIGGVTLGLTSVPYARVTATFNPGLWPTTIGLALAVMGVLGSVVWPAGTAPTAKEEEAR